MRRIISAFRLLMPQEHQLGPLIPSSDGEVPSEAVGDFLNAIYVAVEKIRAFGLADDDFGGKIKVVMRKPGEKANGRYIPKSDQTVIFYPPLNGVPDWPWTVVHETMHRVWVKHVDDAAKELWGMVCDATGKPMGKSAAEALARTIQDKPEKSSLWFYFQKHFGSDLKLFKRWLQSRQVSDSFPSRYANSDPSEAFAEVAAGLIMGRGHAGREIKRSGSMVSKVFLSIVEPLRGDKGIGKVFEDTLLEQQDENFLQTQVDFGYLRVKIPRWVTKNIPGNNIIRLEHRPHATVYYGADKRDLAQITQIVKDYGRSIRVFLGEFDVFEHPEQDVLYIKLVGDALPQLHRSIRALPNSRDQSHPEYVPHLTVAYLKKGTGRKYIGTTPFRMVASARGVTVVDASGIEHVIRASPDESLTREPILLAGR